METTLYCNKCLKVHIDDSDVEDDNTHYKCGGYVERVCEHCLGSGEVTVDEQVYPNEPHYAPIGTRKCICQMDGHDGDGEDD